MLTASLPRMLGMSYIELVTVSVTPAQRLDLSRVERQSALTLIGDGGSQGTYNRPRPCRSQNSSSSSMMQSCLSLLLRIP